MNYQQLKILCLIYEHKNLSVVARIMGIRQPTVTFHVRKLEEATGVILFKQHAKFIYLTDAGLSLLHYAKRIVNWMDEAEKVMRDYRNETRGRAVIGASTTPALYMFPSLLKALQEVSPMIQIQLQIENTPQLIELLQEFRLDFVIAAGEPVDASRLCVVPLMKDELGMVCHPLHRLARQEQVTVEDWSTEKMILREQGSSTRLMIDQWMSASGLNCDHMMELGSTEVIKKAVSAELGVSILSKLSVQKEVEEGTLIFRELGSAQLERQIFLMYNRDRVLLPYIGEMIQYIQECFCV